MLSKVHIPVPVEHPKHPGTITSVPLLCGKPWEHSTRTTYAIERVTCGRCLALHAKFREDLEHKQTKARLEQEQVPA